MSVAIFNTHVLPELRASTIKNLIKLHNIAVENKRLDFFHIVSTKRAMGYVNERGLGMGSNVTWVGSFQNYHKHLPLRSGGYLTLFLFNRLISEVGAYTPTGITFREQDLDSMADFIQSYIDVTNEVNNQTLNWDY